MHHPYEHQEFARAVDLLLMKDASLDHVLKEWTEDEGALPVGPRLHYRLLTLCPGAY